MDNLYCLFIIIILLIIYKKYKKEPYDGIEDAGGEEIESHEKSALEKMSQTFTPSRFKVLKTYIAYPFLRPFIEFGGIMSLFKIPLKILKIYYTFPIIILFIVLIITLLLIRSILKIMMPPQIEETY